MYNVCLLNSAACSRHYSECLPIIKGMYQNNRKCTSWWWKHLDLSQISLMPSSDRYPFKNKWTSLKAQMATFPIISPGGFWSSSWQICLAGIYFFHRNNLKCWSSILYFVWVRAGVQRFCCGKFDLVDVSTFSGSLSHSGFWHCLQFKRIFSLI